ARLQLPAGQYTVYAGRGFEYSVARKEVTVAAGESLRVALEIRREVPTDGYVACDTHVHTLTHSGHGDATIEERMLTIAGEGIELPIATDHNKHIDYEPTARALNLRTHFTPVMGNEVTTSRGHFNIFPVPSGSAVPNHRLGSWRELLAEMVAQTDPPVIILNHAQDLHSGVRPFGPKLFNAVVAEHEEEWSARLNAMEVINSGATQSDPLQLFQNWMALLNRGRMMTPIGSSDSHDVARHFVGQGRTYIRCDDRDPGAISIPHTVEALQRGRVLVSYGLLTELTVNDEYRSGDVAPVGDNTCRVAIRVLGPHWTNVRHVRLYANGQLIREVDITSQPSQDHPAGVLWAANWELPRQSHDVHLVAIATGLGITAPYWPTAKPYQPTSPNGDTQVIGCSGAVWLDVDGDGQPTPARTYAERLFADHRADLKKLITALDSYDAAVAAHVAYLQHQSGVSPTDPEIQAAWRAAAPAARQGFQDYVEAWRQCEIARQTQ
ncbi:MAG TPA: CehA/McbA family metallohydrolase, partial [Planctomycetaceae bacterium]|nr:CehA/McbA family metallohydrolase [Planctomycetaceae bacterium]